MTFAQRETTHQPWNWMWTMKRRNITPYNALQLFTSQLIESQPRFVRSSSANDVNETKLQKHCTDRIWNLHFCCNRNRNFVRMKLQESRKGCSSHKHVKFVLRKTDMMSFATKLHRSSKHLDHVALSFAFARLNETNAPPKTIKT